MRHMTFHPHPPVPHHVTDPSSIDALHWDLYGVRDQLARLRHVVDHQAEAGGHLGRHGHRGGGHGGAAGGLHRDSVSVGRQVLPDHLPGGVGGGGDGIGSDQTPYAASQPGETMKLK